MIRRLGFLFAALLVFLPAGLLAGDAPTGLAIVKEAWDYMREDTSRSTVEMVIHREDWERNMTILAFTRGEHDSVFWITAPPKDAGNGTLKKGTQMWMYNPKVNRTIRIPPSMMAQSWMGSDFSNEDLAKSDTVVNDYNHTVKETRQQDGKTVYLIQSIPKPQAPVVWGMLEMEIREDHVLLSERYYDQDKELVKEMVCKDIRKMGGKIFPCTWRMHKADAEGEYTLLKYQDIAFNVKLAPNLFTLSSLTNPPR